jgi:uncharacterized RDD family membrane protein YckC
MDQESTSGSPAGLLRRLAALFYDLLLMAALAATATFAMLPLTHGEALLGSTQGLAGRLYQVTWPLLVFAYFGWCWTRSGQTLGMKAWKFRLETEIGGRLRWSGAAQRFLLGAGLFWLACVGAWYLLTADSPLARAGAVTLLAPIAVNFAWIRFDREGRSVLDVVGRTRARRTRNLSAVR